MTPDGTTYYRNLTSHDKKQFYADLETELALAIPIRTERITSNKNFEIDISLPRNSPEQLILSINIVGGEVGEKSVDSAIEDLDTLIRNKFVTVISSGEYSKYLDERFGYERLRKNSFLKIIR